jgi:UDP-glucose 4-epimerase
MNIDLTTNGIPKHRVFVTGGAGFIGSNFVDFLLQMHYNVIAIDDLSTGNKHNLENALKNPNFLFFEMDVKDFDWKNQLRKEDQIVHLASTVGVKKVYESALSTAENNHDMLDSILRATKKFKNRLIYASTSEVYGDSPSTSSKESDSLQVHVLFKGRSAYTLSKLFGEILCLSTAIEEEQPITVVRLFNTIGNRQAAEYGMVVPNFIKQSIKNEPIIIYGDGQQTRSFVSVDDIVRALKALLDNPKSYGEVYNIGNPNEITIESLADFICKSIGSKSQKIFAELPQERIGQSDIRFRKPDINKIKNEIGWYPSILWQDEIIKMIQALRQPNT